MKTPKFLLLGLAFYSTVALGVSTPDYAGYNAMYGCLGPDGVAFTDPKLILDCCDTTSGLARTDTTLPPECTTSIGQGTDGGTLSAAQTSIHIAQHALNTVKDLSGATADYKADTTAKADTSAITAGTGGSAGLGINGSNGSGFSPPTGSASTAGGAGTGGSAGSGAGTVGSSSALTADGKKADTDPAGPNGAGAYGKGGGKGSGGEGKGGLAGINFGSLFGGGGGKAEGDGNSNLNFSGDEAAAGKDPTDMSGSSVDPSDYFGRIDKSANLFKVVTIRYGKEVLKKRVGSLETAKLSP